MTTQGSRQYYTYKQKQGSGCPSSARHLEAISGLGTASSWRIVSYGTTQYQHWTSSAQILRDDTLLPIVYQHDVDWRCHRRRTCHQTDGESEKRDFLRDLWDLEPFLKAFDYRVSTVFSESASDRNVNCCRALAI